MRSGWRLTLFLIAASLAEAPPGAKAEPAVLIPFDEARPIIEANGKHMSAGEWPAWAATRNREIRARLAQGDEDSVVNLWLYGTSFSKRPRVTDETAARLGTPEAIQDLLVARLDDFVAALARPGTNERLQFARDLVSRQGIDLATAAGREKAEAYLVTIRERTIAEHKRYTRDSASPSSLATLYSDRGLSTDTRLTASFAIDKALAALAASGWAPAGGVKRVAIVGPGLDFTDKAEGYDFYPLQTIQPFAVVDSLARLTMAPVAGVRITTLDLSPRVNRHLDAARRRSALGTPYVVQLPLATDQPSHEWQPDLVAYWQRFGSAIGKSVPAVPPPAIAGGVRVRAISIRPSIVTAVTPEDVNIIVERLPLREDERFDLVIATNILVYYDAFEQSLALANIASMLKPGGFFLTNYAVAPLPPLESKAGIVTPVFFDKQQNGDTVYCYQRR
jgi:SAM-dependent methyltransferase